MNPLTHSLPEMIDHDLLLRQIVDLELECAARKRSVELDGRVKRLFARSVVHCLEHEIPEDLRHHADVSRSLILHVSAHANTLLEEGIIPASASPNLVIRMLKRLRCLMGDCRGAG